MFAHELRLIDTPWHTEGFVFPMIIPLLTDRNRRRCNERTQPCDHASKQGADLRYSPACLDMFRCVVIVHYILYDPREGCSERTAFQSAEEAEIPTWCK